MSDAKEIANTLPNNVARLLRSMVDGEHYDPAHIVEFGLKLPGILNMKVAGVIKFVPDEISIELTPLGVAVKKELES